MHQPEWRVARSLIPIGSTASSRSKVQQWLIPLGCIVVSLTASLTLPRLENAYLASVCDRWRNDQRQSECCKSTGQRNPVSESPRVATRLGISSLHRRYLFAR
jgi:hypothetical protein